MFQKTKRTESKSTLDDVKLLPCCAFGVDPGGDAHHIDHKGQGGPDSFFNLLPLCRACHTEAHTGMVRFYQKHQSVRRAMRLRNWELVTRFGVMKIERKV